MINRLLHITLIVFFISICFCDIFAQDRWKHDCLSFVNGFENSISYYTIEDIKPMYNEISNYQLCELETMSYLKDSMFILKSRNIELPDKVILRLGDTTVVYDGITYLHVINVLSSSLISRCELSLFKIWAVDNVIVGSMGILKTRNWIKNTGQSSKDLFPKHIYFSN